MTCAKIDVRAMLICKNKEVVLGSNYCSNPQETCPRKPGEGYDKCTYICGQNGHAEEVAISKALASGYNVNNARLYLAGHNAPCSRCKELMRKHNIECIILTPDANMGVKPTL